MSDREKLPTMFVGFSEAGTDMMHLQAIELLLGLCLFLLAYAYVIFPVLAGWIGRRGQRNRNEPLSISAGRADSLPFVSMIVPAYNEEALIEAKIQNSLAIDYPADRLEILIGCDGASDSTAEIVRKSQSSRVHLFAFPVRRGKASVINDLVERANGELLLMCDANVMFAADAPQRLAAHFQDPQVGAVSGDVRLRSEDASFGLAESLYYRMERRIHTGESRLGAMMGVDGGMYMVRRSLFRPVPQDAILDDFTISMSVLRENHQILYEPAAVAHENATETAVSEFKRRVRIGAGTAQVIARGIHPALAQPLQWWLFVSHKLLRWISPWLLLAAAVLTLYLAIYQPVYRVLLGVAAAIVGLGMIGVLLPSTRRHWLVSVPFYFLISQIAMGWGFARGILFQQQAVWERTDRPSKSAVAGADSQSR